MWRLCRGEEADAAAVSAVEVLEKLPPSAELAYAYANLAQQDMAREPAEAVSRARQAQVLAEQFGTSAVLSEALNTEGCARVSLGEDGLIQAATGSRRSHSRRNSRNRQDAPTRTFT